MNVKNNVKHTQEHTNGYFNIPKSIINDSRFQKLSAEAVLLYGLMLDRLKLSIKNGWKDNKNRTYIIFTVEEVQKDCRCCHTKAIKVLKQLVTIGLIARKKLGQGKPAITYVNRNLEDLKQEVKKPEVQEVKKPEVQKPEVRIVYYPQGCQQENDSYAQCYAQEVQILDLCNDSALRKAEKETSRSAKNELLEVSNTECSNTDISNTDISNSIYESYQSINSEENMYKKLVCENINYEYLTTHTKNKDDINELVEIIVDVLTSSKEYININKEKRPIALVKGVFSKLKTEHIEYVLWCLEENTSKIHNIYAYLVTVLFNAPRTMNKWYQNKVNYNMATSV